MMKSKRLSLFTLTTIAVLCLNMLFPGIFLNKALAADEPTNLTVWIHEGYVKNLKRWGIDEVSKTIQEKTGVHLDISTGDGENDGTKLSLLIASNDLPDMLIVPKLDPNAFVLQEEGFAADIEELARKYNCENLIRLIDETNDFNLKYNRFEGGNYWGGKDAPLYVWPDYFVDKYTYENSRLDQIQERKAWLVRQDIYEAEGSPDLSNMEDYIAFLHTIKDKYKDVNGNPISPMGILNSSNQREPLAIVYGSFAGVAEDLVYDEDGVRYAYTTPEYKEAMVFLNRLYREGLLDQEAYTETYDQWNDKLKLGGIGVVPVWYWHADGANLELEKHGIHYQAIPAANIPKAQGIDKPVLNVGWGIGVGFGWRCNFINAAASEEKKEAAIKFLDYMYSHEGQMLAWFGLPGEYYEPAQAWEEASLPLLQNKEIVLKDTPKLAEAKEQYGSDYMKETGADNFWGFWCIQGYTDFLGTTGGASKVSPITQWNTEQARALSEYDIELCKKLDINGLAMADLSAKTIIDNIKLIRDRWHPIIVMAPSEEEARNSYDSMLKEIENVGLAELETTLNNIYTTIMLPLLNE